jgi:D-alanine-D-alanine ligase-like ATP-grasp enzyme
MQDTQTLQGLNLESPTTSVKIDKISENKDLRNLLELIYNFHPIFIETYLFKDNILTIRSKLPALWRDSAKTFRQLSTGEITYEKAKDYVVDTLIKRKIKSMSTIPILHRAQNLGYETTLTIADEGIIPGTKQGYGYKWNRYYTIGCGEGSHVTCSISSSKDSTFAKNIQEDKWRTNKLIERMGLPLPKWRVITSKNHIRDVWEEYEKPVVIKPTGLTGGHGVTVNIKTLEKAYQAFKHAKEAVNSKNRKAWQKKIMIQEQAEGDDNGADYRLLVIDGKLKVCTKRIPAFVTGDGKHSIKQLVENENKDPRRDISNPAHILKPIEIDQPLIDFLKEQDLTLQSVPKKDKRVYVRNVASMSRGGITQDYTDQVSPEIKAIVESIAATMHVFTLGLDIICNDISQPLTKENGAILEVNTMPESYLNFFPTIGQEQTEAIDYYIQQLLKECKTKKIVTIGQSKNDIPTLLQQKKIIGKEEDVGLYKNRKIIINNCEFNDNMETWKAVEALKINAILDTIILQYRDVKDVREHGLGFDRIDYLFLTKKARGNKKAMKIFRKYKRKGYINKIKTL